MVGSAQAAAARFYATNSGASAHYGVLKTGELWHWVDEDNTAYHAGNYAMNQRSIGIEHEDNGMVNGVYDDGARPDALYISSARLIRDICLFYGIPIDRQHILKHKEVSDAPTACPDALDVDRIVAEAGGTPNQSTLIDQLRADRDKNWNLYQQQLAHSIDQESTIAAKQKTIDTITAENLNLKSLTQQASEQHSTDLGAIAGLTQDKETLSTEVLNYQSQLAKVTTDLQTCQTSKSDISYATPKQLFAELLKKLHLS
jgi:hypothetical protein